jgi:hypothetical protein
MFGTIAFGTKVTIVTHGFDFVLLKGEVDKKFIALKQVKKCSL